MLRRNRACFFNVAGGKTYRMPKVDAETGEPMSDAPEGADETRGGMERGDPGLAGATETRWHIIDRQRG